MNPKGNALVSYGGGLGEGAAFYIAQLAQALSKRKIFGKVMVGMYSFQSLLIDGLIKDWTPKMYEFTKDVQAGYFGTARDTDLSDPILMKRAISICKQHNISWIFLAGGDGSSRQMSEICDGFAAEGINFCFTMPLTVDGIEGGDSFGLAEAVSASLKRIRNVSSTFLRTLERNCFPGAIIIVQGRNRDDILANVIFELDRCISLGDFPKEEIDIVAIPANMEWSRARLKEILNVDKTSMFELAGRPKLVLMSEGASITANEIIDMSNIKFRTEPVGYETQVNGLLSTMTKYHIGKVIEEQVATIEKVLYQSNPHPFTLVTRNSMEPGKTLEITVEAPDYFARLNPRKNQIVTLAPELEAALKKYLP